MNAPFTLRKTSVSSHFDWPQTLHPLLKRIYSSRLQQSFDETQLTFEQLLDPLSLKGVEQAAHIIIEAIEQQSKVLIVGDFDVDGATSTALAMRALPLFGIRQLDYLVPNRFNFGYGLSVGLVKEAIKLKPELIITVDNGISSIDGIKLARQHDIKVIVTDHHLAGEQLPDAQAIVNPNQPGDQFASKNLAGVGVMFYLLLGLRKCMREQQLFAKMAIKEPNLANFLDLVALGTVADVVPLDQNNRILVKEGLKRIRAGLCVPGISALLKVAGRQPATVVAADMGFAVGPRLNAAGRLDDMTIGIACLLADEAEAFSIAQRLNELNQERRQIESEMQQSALAYLQQIEADNINLSGVVLFDEDWHQGVIGILASRVKEKLHRPVVIMAAGDDQQIKGSARSIPGIHIRDVFAAVDTRHPGLIIKFGGHAMAAGLTIHEDGLQTFMQAFNSEVERIATDDILNREILTDGPLAANEFSFATIDLLEQAGPWGQGFPEPVFSGEFEVIQQRILKDRHYKLVLKPKLANADENLYLDGIAFNQLDGTESQTLLPEEIAISYKLNINEFNGNRNLQLMIDTIHSG